MLRGLGVKKSCRVNMCLFTGCKTNITTQPLLVQSLLHPPTSHGGSQHQNGQVTLLLFVFIRLSCQVDWKQRRKDTFCMLSEQPLTQPCSAVSLVTQQKCTPHPPSHLPTPLPLFLCALFLSIPGTRLALRQL